VRLADVTKFEWDRVVFVRPGGAYDEISNDLGAKYPGDSMNEGQVLFQHNGVIVHIEQIPVRKDWAHTRLSSAATRFPPISGM
jgi:hypothetical protein